MTPSDRAIIERLMERFGLSRSGILRIAIRRLDKEGTK